MMGGSTLVPFDLKEFPPGVGSPASGAVGFIWRESGELSFVDGERKVSPEVKDERLKRPKWEEGRDEGRRVGLGFMLVAPLPLFPKLGDFPSFLVATRRI